MGDRVAILGAGGIGFDVAEFLTDGGEKASEDPAAYFRQWGVDMDYRAPGGLAAPERPAPPRSVHLLQRKTSKVGAGLGKTTGWIHRTELKHRGVTMVPGVQYDLIDDAGLHVTVDGVRQVLEVDTVVLCTGQDPRRDLYDDLVAAGAPRTSSVAPTWRPNWTPSGRSSRGRRWRRRCRRPGHRTRAAVVIPGPS